MTITRVKPDFALGDKLTSDEMDAIDTNATYALDKRAGETDTLASVITCSGAGRIIQTIATGVDANTTYLIDDPNASIRVTSAVTASRTYTLSATGAQTGDVVTVFCESSFNASYEILVKDQSAATMFAIGNGDSADGQWASFIYVSGWRLFRGGQGSRSRAQTFTSSGSFVVPRGVTLLHYAGCGGGGGGGGAYIAAGAFRSDSPGGGGGGALLTRGSVSTTPGETLNLNPGAGGLGGTGGSGASAGSNGTDSTIVRVTGSVTIATLRAAGGGARGTSVNEYAISDVALATEDGANSPVYKISDGGSPVRGPTAYFWRTFESFESFDTGSRSPTPQAGGWGVSRRVTGRTGGASPQGYAGGAGGSVGTNDGDYYGGSGGGGGGAGPYGVGAAGGAGGNANDAGSATNGSDGSAASANTGAGGGGGGSAGGSSSLTGDGGAGGAGGSGQITLFWVK